MENVTALLFALGGNIVSLLSGIIGLVATLLSLIFKETPYSKWFMRAGIAALILSPSFAWIEEHKIRMGLQVDRPHVFIQGVPADAIHAYALRDPRNPVFPDAAYVPGYILGWGSDAETLAYNTTNIGKVTARGLKHFCRIKTVDVLGIETDIKLPELPDRKEILIPEQSVTQTRLIPSGTFYTETKANGLRITLLVTYSGQSSDKNVYFYLVKLRARQFAGSPQTLATVADLITAESTDEGVVTNLDDLLR